MGIRISGIGAYVPARIVTNHELAARLDTSHDWIIARTGIVERRLAGPDEAPSDMGSEAARRCLNDAGVDASAWPICLVGMMAAGLVGYFSVAALLCLVIDMRLVPFIAYTGALGLFLLVRSA